MADAFGGSSATSPGSRSSRRPGPPARAPRASRYDREIGEVKDNVLRMGSLVEAQIRAAIERARRPRRRRPPCRSSSTTASINEVQRKATAMIAAVIATQNPVARDLRYLLTLDHVSYELERMGDHAASVAKQARKLAPYPPLKDYVAAAAAGRARRGARAGHPPRARRRGRGPGARGRRARRRDRRRSTTGSSTRCSS